MSGSRLNDHNGTVGVLLLETIKLFEENHDAQSIYHENYDTVDELLHVHFGYTWVPVMLKVNHDPRSTRELVDECHQILEAGGQAAAYNISTKSADN